MSKYNFDNPPSRVNTLSAKWQFEPYKINHDVPRHPHWCADMDFQSAPAIMEAMKTEVERGIFGYGCCPNDLHEIISNYLKEQNWDLSVEYL